MNGLTIGRMAKQAGVSNDTVRFYERCGLIEPAGRTAANYRLYHAEDVERLRFIRRAKDLGFSLNEIKELLALSHDPRTTKADIKRITQEKAKHIRARIRDLTRILHALDELNELCDGHGPADDCPILRSLNSDDEAAAPTGSGSHHCHPATTT